jgi:hypothetical protein
MKALGRIVRLVLSPEQEWQQIAGEDTSISVLIRHYLLPLSLLAPVATFVGMQLFNAEWSAEQGYRVPASQIFEAAATTFLASILSVFVLAAIFVALAPFYRSTRDYRVALKVATFGAVPLLLAGAALFLPVLAIVGVVALVHSLFLYWLGAKHVLQVTRAEQAEFVGIALVLLAVASTIAGGALSALGVF